MKPLRILLALIVVTAIAVGVWYTRSRRTRTATTAVPATPAGTSSQTASSQSARPLPADAVEPYYVGVSSLDVEENERAARLFDSLSKTIPDEPTVWANLGLARLRLGDVEGAMRALDQAAQRAPKDESIAVLQATADDNQGDFARAIERLRGIANPSAAVLYHLSDLISRSGNDSDGRQQAAVLDRLHQLQPQNPVVVFEQARLFARAENASALQDSIAVLKSLESDWSPAALHQFDSFQAAVAAKNFRGAGAQLSFLQNLVAPSPSYQHALAELDAAGGSIGRAWRRPEVYRASEIAAAAPDEGLQFKNLTSVAAATPGAQFLVALPLGSKLENVLLSLTDGKWQLHVNGQHVMLGDGSAFGTATACAADLNGDFLQDLAIADRSGLRLWWQDRNGHFDPFSPPETVRAEFQKPALGVWALDYDADGDLDLLVARPGAAPVLFRNNGDGTFTPLETFSRFPEIRQIAWADFDNDGDNDLAFVDVQGRLFIAWNDRAGAFGEPKLISDSSCAALAVGNLFGNPEMSVVALEQSGALAQFHFDREKGAWARHELARVGNATALASAFAHGQTNLCVADFDNNGAPDFLVSVGADSQIWLNDGKGAFRALGKAPAMFVASIADMNGDGLLDVVGTNAQGAAIEQARATKHYHWQSIQTKTLASNADSRINSFGLGGRIEARAGPLLTCAPIDGPTTHLGLGEQAHVGVARVVWPNGVAQVEFDLTADKEVTAVQRLKGSCPWVFTRLNGTFRFAKDFIWRSPLGMRINSQDTAGVNQTSDWILIPGSWLDAEKNAYEVRITAELWETHFFDQVSLRVIDHPANTVALVDERFVPTQPPELRVIQATPPQPFDRVIDQAGRDETQALVAVDERYVNDFPLGRYQGIAEDHWLEFEVPAAAPRDKPLVLVGDGWIYPTDSSLNVAISQGNVAVPHDLSLEEFDPQSGWKTVNAHLGFPAGKNKTVVIPLPQTGLAAGQRRFRLRTNLEIYWNRLAWAVEQPSANLKITPVETLSADLHYRGFTRLPAPVRRMPDEPRYASEIERGARWRDLEGYYTRFGDVRELLENLDDRYVIMNAGDEMTFRFAALPAPPEGWSRDFVLVGDGWVKDGDFNTANSETVQPLPAHGQKNYGRGLAQLEDDPVFQAHADDWRRFHTRYVAPAAFAQGLMNDPISLDPLR